MTEQFQPQRALLPVAATLVALLAAMFYPPLGVLVGVLIPVPLVFIYVQLGRRPGVILLALVFGVMFTLMGPKQAVLFFTEYAVLAGVMAETIRFRLPFDKCILFSTLFSATLSIILLFFIFTDRESTLTEFFQQQIDGHFKQSMEALKGMGDKPEDLKAMQEFADRTSGVLAQSYPSFIIIGTFITAVINYYAARFLWGRIYGSGLFHPARFSEWAVPDQTVWVFIGSGALCFLADGTLGVAGITCFFWFWSSIFFKDWRFLFIFWNRGMFQCFSGFLFFLS